MAGAGSEKLLIATNTSDFFLSHRLHLAEGARAAGWDVWVMCPPGEKVKLIIDKGFSVIEIEMGRQSMNPFNELKTIRQMYRAVRKLQPAIFHGFTVKPVLYGTIVCRLLKTPRIINTITGLGFLFLSSSLKVRLVRSLLGLCYRILFANRHVQLIFQNKDDRSLFISRGWAREDRAMVIPGTGIDIEHFKRVPEPATTPVILFPARLLFDKGIRELISAADILKNRGHHFVLELCGRIDPGNPAALDTDAVKALSNSGTHIQFRGHVENMSDAFQKCHIVCLPSYREGLPLALLEALGSGRPIVTTDVPGCRAVVEDGVHGFLVPSHNVDRLVEALEKLLRSKDLRTTMGLKGRERAVREFAKESIIKCHLELYGLSASNLSLATVA